MTDAEAMDSDGQQPDGERTREAVDHRWGVTLSIALGLFLLLVPIAIWLYRAVLAGR